MGEEGWQEGRQESRQEDSEEGGEEGRQEAGQEAGQGGAPHAGWREDGRRASGHGKVFLLLRQRRERRFGGIAGQLGLSGVQRSQKPAQLRERQVQQQE